ncbi:hypothetical protein Esti_004962 [Eimeria stiedai]
MELDGEEGPPGGGPSGGPPPISSRSKGKPASFFLEKAEECFSSFPPNVPVAIKFLEKGLTLHPENTELLERLGGEYAEAGRIEEAKALLQKAIQLEPSSGATKYCQLAQLEEGFACLPLYSKGIALLEASLAACGAPRGKAKQAPNKNACSSSLSPEALELRSQLVAAYCSVAELYLTDLCEEENAETRAEEAIDKALKMQPDSTQAILCHAQLCKVRDDAEGAVAAARRLHLLLKRYQEQLACCSLLLPGSAAAQELNYEEEISLETRVNACRLLVDVGLAEEATEILRACLEEQDDDPQVWLVLCCALFKLNDLSVTLECLDGLRKRLQSCGIPGEHPMAQHERQLRELVQKGLLEQQQQQQQGAEESMLSFIDEEEAEAEAAAQPAAREPLLQPSRRRLLLAPHTTSGSNGSSSSSSVSEGPAAGDATADGAPVFRARNRKLPQEQQSVVGPCMRPTLTHKEFLRQRAAELSAEADAAAAAPAGAAGAPENGSRKRARKTGWSEPGEEGGAGEKGKQVGQTGWGAPIDPKVREERLKAIEAAVERDAERRRRGYGKLTEEQEAETALQRMWYDRDDTSGLQLGDYEDDDSRLAEKEAKLKRVVGGGPSRGTPRGAPARSLAEQQRHRDNELWESVLMHRGGAATRQEVDLDFEEAEEIEKEHVVCRQITPPFLAGFKPSERTITVVRDATSDMAMLAKKGSAVLRHTKDAEDRAAVRQRFWEVAGSTLGSLMQGAEGREAAAAAEAAAGAAAEAEAVGGRSKEGYAAALRNVKQACVSEFSRSKTKKEQRESLPVFTVRSEFLAICREHRVIVVVGETGSGKTTQLTQYLLEEGYARPPAAATATTAAAPVAAEADPTAAAAAGLTSGGIIGCTQPRRVAAVSVAKRVAEEMGCELGTTVGYSIRFEDCTSADTLIKYMTDGVLLRESLSDPDLDKYSCVIMDEAHERSLNTDILFGVLKGVVARRRDFKLIVTSATMDSERFSSFFGGAVVFTIPGRTFPVEVEFARCLPDDYVDAAVQKCLAIHCSTPFRSGTLDPSEGEKEGQETEGGDILVFMTGQDDIEVTCLLLASRLEQLGNRAPPITILPIYSQLPADLQAKIFEPSAYRKVIVATNIAETSLTVDGVRYVVDCGYCKLKVFNPSIGMDALQVTPISQANANQRKGRAGRTGPGKCFRLYTETAFIREMLPNTVPEVQRTNLSNVVLLLKSIGVANLLDFDLIDPPPQDTFVDAMFQLWVLGALDNLGGLTQIGRKMAMFPLDPPLSKMLLTAAESGAAREMVSIVSLLSVPAVFFVPKEKQEEAESLKEKFFVPESDHLTLLNVYQQWKRARYNAQWCLKHFVQPKAMVKAREVREQLVDVMTQQGMPDNSCGTDWDVLRKAICAGYLQHAAKLRGIGEYVNLRTSVPCHVHPTSALFSAGYTPDYVVYHELLLTTKEYMRNVTAVDARWLADLGPMFFSLRRMGQGIRELQAEDEAEAAGFLAQMERDLERQRQQQLAAAQKEQAVHVEATPGRKKAVTPPSASLLLPVLSDGAKGFKAKEINSSKEKQDEESQEDLEAEAAINKLRLLRKAVEGAKQLAHIRVKDEQKGKVDLTKFKDHEKLKEE